LHLRDWLTADNAGSTTTREAAFALVTRPVTAAIALRPPAESKADDRIAFNQAARVAAAVSRNLKIVVDPARELPRDFTALAFPLLEQVAPVATPGIAHDILGTVAWSAVASSRRSQTAGAAAKAGAHPSPAQAAALQAEIYHHALATGFSRGFLVAAGILALILIIPVFMMRVTREDLSGTDPMSEIAGDPDSPSRP